MNHTLHIIVEYLCMYFGLENCISFHVVTIVVESSSCKERSLRFFCGFDSRGVDVNENKLAEERANKISSLKQVATSIQYY